MRRHENVYLKPTVRKREVTKSNGKTTGSEATKGLSSNPAPILTCLRQGVCPPAPLFCYP